MSEKDYNAEKEQMSGEKDQMSGEKDVEGHVFARSNEPQINSEPSNARQDDDEGEDVEGHMYGINAEPDQTNAMNTEPEQNG